MVWVVRANLKGPSGTISALNTAVSLPSEASPSVETLGEPTNRSFRFGIPAGKDGERGLPGVNAVPADEAVAAYLHSGPVSSVAFDSLARGLISSFGGGTSGVYLPSPLAALRLRQRRQQVAAATKQGHLAFLGDSIMYGAAAAGATPPKNLTSYPGRVRTVLANRFGNAGTGMTICNHALLTNPTWDNQIKAVGNVTSYAGGFHKMGGWRVGTGAGNYVEYTAVCDEFWVWNMSASGNINNASVDGEYVGSFRDIKGTGGNPATLPMEAGYGGSQIMTRIPAGQIGTHTLRISSGAAAMVLVGIEGRVAKNGTWRVSNPSISGRSLGTLWADSGNADVANEIYGLGLVDSLRADILAIGLGINDWHNGLSRSQIKDRLRVLIQRQRSTGTSAATIPGNHAGGEALLVFPPQVSLNASGYPTYAAAPTVPWEQARAAFYEIALEQDVALVDFGFRWDGFARGNSAGLFADELHPSDYGALDLADGIVQALFEVI